MTNCISCDCPPPPHLAVVSAKKDGSDVAVGESVRVRLKTPEEFGYFFLGLCGERCSVLGTNGLSPAFPGPRTERMGYETYVTEPGNTSPDQRLQEVQYYSTHRN